MEADYILEGGDTRNHTARKPHRCDECWGHIQPGETYTRICGSSPDGWEVYKRCSDCVALIEELEKHGDTVCLGMLCDFLGDSLDSGNEEDRTTARRFNEIRTRRGKEPFYEADWFEEH